MKKIIVFAISALTSLTILAQNNFEGQWVDLTHAFSEESIYWPTADTFKKTTVAEGDTDAGYYYSAYNFSAAEHGGTHLDAPIHFSKTGNSVDQIQLEQFVGNGVLIRIADKAMNDRNYQLSVEDILQWERENGPIENNSILLIDTGSSKFWPDMKKYMGTDERGEAAVSKLVFPGIHPSAAQFLVTQRQIKAVGLDTPSIDFGGSRLFESHQILYAKNVLGFENVANLGELPAKGFTVIALPMKIAGGSGGPLRIVAFIPAK